MTTTKNHRHTAIIPDEVEVTQVGMVTAKFRQAKQADGESASVHAMMFTEDARKLRDALIALNLG